MADMISNVNGMDEFTFTGSRDAIWHKKGQEICVGASIDEWAGMPGFKHGLKRAPVQYDTGDYMRPGISADKHVIFRDDNMESMGIVSADYKLIQPKEVLESTRALIESAGFQLSAGGTLFGGRRYWITADIGEEAIIMGNDAMRRYFMLVTSCDGSLATIGKFTDVRGVCHNTISAALKDGNKEYKLSHRSIFDPAKLHDAMGIAKDGFYAFIKDARKLAAQTIDQQKAREFVQALILAPNVPMEDQSTQSLNKCDQILSLYNGLGMGSAMDSAKGTAWGLVNAVTEYVDHHSPVRGANASDNRFDSANFGKGDFLKSEAFEAAMALV